MRLGRIHASAEEPRWKTAPQPCCQGSSDPLRPEASECSFSTACPSLPIPISAVPAKLFLDQHYCRIGRVRRDNEPEFPAHLQHRLVLAQDLADEFPDAASA